MPVFIRVDMDARSPAEYRAPDRSLPMSVVIGDQARELRRRYPELHQDVIGVILGVNHGRISNALRGWWSARFPRGPRPNEVRRPGVFRVTPRVAASYDEGRLAA
jgi:hypothetical protein